MKQGDWVTNEEGYVFFIVDCNTLFARIGTFVEKTEDSERKVVVETELLNLDELILDELEGYSEEEIKFLINLALDTNDKQWFNELTARLQQLQEVAL